MQPPISMTLSYTATAGTAGLTANPAKCRLGLEETAYLGYQVGRGNVRPQESKVAAIRDWPRPTSKKQVKSFLGLVGYYQRFIPGFATLASPLNDLTRKALPDPTRQGERQRRCPVPPGCMPGLDPSRPHAAASGEGVWQPAPHQGDPWASGGRRIPPPPTSRRQRAQLHSPQSTRWGTPGRREHKTWQTS